MNERKIPGRGEKRHWRQKLWLGEDLGRVKGGLAYGFREWSFGGYDPKRNQ